jgi:hypothetical protein
MESGYSSPPASSGPEEFSMDVAQQDFVLQPIWLVVALIFTAIATLVLLWVRCRIRRRKVVADEAPAGSGA